MNDQKPQLDADELLHFAVQASQNQQNEKAILYLKHALQQAPDNAKLHYFLGAEHAAIGMMDRAIEEMSHAVKLAPELETAHFQLGLLYATSAQIEQADKAWRALDKLGENNPLYLFKTGLLQLADDDFENATENLSRGISVNHANPDLNTDMQRILEGISQTANTVSDALKGESLAEPGEIPGKTSSNHVFLSAYHLDGDESNDDDNRH